MLKRCYYISNAYDGKYFVLTDNVGEFAQRMAAYLMNLERSGKLNHYSFGSVEMSENEYLTFRTEASHTESSRIAATQEAKAAKEETKKDKSAHLKPVDQNADYQPMPPKNENKGDRPGLRLV